MSATAPIRIHTPAGPCWVDPTAVERFAIPAADLERRIAAIVETRREGRILKRDLRSVVYQVPGETQSWIVKGYFLGDVKSAVYGALRLTPAWREWRAATVLHAAGIRIVQPLALFGHAAVREPDELLVLPYIDAPTLAQFLAADPPRPQWSDEHRAARLAMAGAIGRQIGRMIGAGRINRDHKATNLLVDAACQKGEAEPWLIDAGGLRRYRGRSQLDRVFELLCTTARSAGTWTEEEEAACRAAAKR